MSHSDYHSSTITWTGPKLDGNNYELFEKTLQPLLRHFGNPGKTIKDGLDRLPGPCSAHDLIPGTQIYMYDHLILTTDTTTNTTSLMINNHTIAFVILNSPGATHANIHPFSGHEQVHTISEHLSQTGTTQLQSDIKTRKTELEDYLVLSEKLITLTLSGMTPEICSALELIPEYVDAKDNNMCLPSWILHSTGRLTR